MNILSDQFVFLLAIAGLFFLPGFLLLSLVFHRRTEKFFLLEYVALSFALGIFIIDFDLLLLSRIGVPITRISILAFVTLFVISLLLFFWRENKWKFSFFSERLTLFDSFAFSKREGLLFAGIVLLAIFIKAVFLWDTIIPTSTDLGHHMFWSKKIALEGTVPQYEKINIAFENGENTLTAPEPIDDFVVGEHLPFAAISLATGLDFVSSFPSLFLFLVNILTLLALALLAYRLFEDILPTKTLARRGMIATLLFLGPLWALSSPEAKYVSGGVVGNLFGNLLIPLIFLALLRAFREKSAPFLLLAILLFGTLAYTHHLSTLIFLFVVLFIAAAFIILKRKGALADIFSWLKLFASPLPLAGIGFLGAMLLFVYAPTYLDIASVDTALGSPSKGTREGLSLEQLAGSVGGTRFGLELVGIILLLLSPFKKTKKTLSSAVLLGWSVGLMIMILFPGAVFLDIPSNRIGTYATFPAALLGAFAFAFLFLRDSRNEKEGNFAQNHLFRSAFVLFLLALVTGGFFDNAATLPKETNAKEATQTFAVSEWLARRTPPDEWILKDHNYLVADSWMKLFFLRDYSYPLSRGYLRRYTDEVTLREQCTLLMISAPNTPKGQACFESTNVQTVVVNPHYDAAQFNKAKEMSLLYVSDDVAVYRKANDK